MPYLTASYNPWVVLASLLLASFASYVALDLAKRVRTHDRRVALIWWAGGSLVMGTGIWCMHFVGMLAFSLPIALGFTLSLTFGSWVAGVAVSAVALSVAGLGSPTWRRLAVGALAMGAGICAMHYTGMAALDMAPGIVWDPKLVAASALIAVVASAAALLLFVWLRTVDSSRSLACQVMAALVMGAAICGMHYTGMAAANFPGGAVCLSANGLAGNNLGALVAVSSGALSALTLLTSILDARMRSKTAELRLEKEVAEAASRAKSEFLSILSHKLRTPLQSIIGFSELGKLFADGQPRFHDMFADIHDGGHRMLTLINRLLDISNVDGAERPLALRRGDLGALTTEVASEFRPLATARELRIEIPDRLPPLPADFDDFRIRQVMRNVLANAIRFAPAGTAIEVGCHDVGAAGVEVSVRDRGPGIPPQELESIFEPFVQSSRTRDGSGGSGLGLTICRKIMGSHAGSIFAFNAEGGGTLLRIRLPATTQTGEPGTPDAAEALSQPLGSTT